MKKWQSILANITLWAVPLINLWQPFIPPKQMGYITPIIATISVLVAKKTSESNPDGTRAEVAYRTDK